MGTVTTTAIVEPAILFFPLDCSFLGSPLRTNDFHTSVGTTLSKLCQKANGTCVYEDAVSSCGSVVTQISMGITKQLSGGKAVADIVRAAFAAGLLSVEFEGETITSGEVFPIRRN